MVNIYNLVYVGPLNVFGDNASSFDYQVNDNRMGIEIATNEHARNVMR